MLSTINLNWIVLLLFETNITHNNTKLSSIVIKKIVLMLKPII